jgi:hypothetical protein
MSTRRKTPRLARPGEVLTLVDEMMASPVNPMPEADAADRVAVARLHLANIQTAPVPTVMDWRVCAMVGNVVEVMIELGYIDDPDDLLMDGQAALKDAAERALERTGVIRFTGDELRVVGELIDGFADILGYLPHRKVIRAFRETDKRMRALDAGQRRPADYVARRRA